MRTQPPLRVGYVLKRYPRYSETFILRELLAHQAVGAQVEIFALRPPSDPHFQDALATVRLPVHYLAASDLTAAKLWGVIRLGEASFPGFAEALALSRDEEPRDVYQAVRLAVAARERGIDHLHAHFATEATATSRLAARFASLSYSFTAHAKDIFHESVRPQTLAARLRDAAAVVTVSDYNVAYLQASFGSAAARVQRIYNGLDPVDFRYEPPAERPPRVVAVGRLVEKKGFDVLVDACALLARTGREFRCEIVGEGLLEDELRARIGARGLESIVRLVGARPQQETIRRLRSAAVMAMPCVVGADADRDGLPTVLLEAMALGTPCVSTDVTGVPEAIRNGETGLLVPQRDPSALAAAIGRILDHPDLRVALARAARRLIEAEFDVHRNAARLRKLFRACIERHAPAPQAA